MGVHLSRIASSALAVGLLAAPLQARAETAVADGPKPNCANLIAQAAGAVAGAIAQSAKFIQVCNDKGWTSSQCVAQGVVAAQSTLWAWWTTSTAYCQCMPNPPTTYCEWLGILEPPKPGGGGDPVLPPPGPPPPPPMKPVCGPANPVLNPEL
jgi:hypothetical protein